MVSKVFFITLKVAIFGDLVTLEERSLNNKLLLGGKSAREDRLQGFSFFPVDFPRILRLLAFSLGTQALEESISQAT